MQSDAISPRALPHGGRMLHQVEFEIEPSDAARCGQMHSRLNHQMQPDAARCTQMKSAACRTKSSSRLNRSERSS